MVVVGCVDFYWDYPAVAVFFEVFVAFLLVAVVDLPAGHAGFADHHFVVDLTAGQAGCLPAVLAAHLVPYSLSLVPCFLFLVVAAYVFYRLPYQDYLN